MTSPFGSGFDVGPAAASRGLLSGCEGQSLAPQSVTAGLFSVNKNTLILDNTNLSS